MDEYNWKEIFASKFTRELYRIFKGKTLLPKETFGLAKQELLNRGFDFSRIEVYMALWKFEDLVEDVNNEISGRNTLDIPCIRWYGFLTAVALSYFLLGLSGMPLYSLWYPVLLMVISVFTLVCNFLYYRQRVFRAKRIEELEYLKNFLILNYDIVGNEKLQKELVENNHAVIETEISAKFWVENIVYLIGGLLLVLLSIVKK